MHACTGKKVLAEGVSLVGKIAVVTGANSGIGLETVKELNLRGAKVYMLCRSEQRAGEAKKKIVEAGCDPSRLIFSQCDLSKFASVRACGKRLNDAESHIDILINNAGIMFYPQFELTEDGHEMTWQSDHLGPFLLTELLLPLVKNAAEGRIVNLSSAMHLKQNGPIDLSTVDDKSSYSRFAPYNRSKMANVMHARELTRRFSDSGVKNVTANSLHPGVIATDLSRHLPFPAAWTKAIKGVFLKSEEEGAQTTLFLAMAKEVKGVSGGYYADCARAKENPAALDDNACKKLYEYSMKAVGLAKHSSLHHLFPLPSHFIMIVPEEAIHIFTYPVTAISVLANIALIVIILTTHNQHVGAYRFLLLSFAVVDILISIVHFVLVPAIIMTEFGFIFYGFRFMADPTAIGVWMNLLFVALFYQTFVLLAFHYVYRYVLLCNPSWLRWIGRSNPWRNWIALAIVADALYIGGFMLAIKGGWIPNDKTRNAFEPMLKESYNIDLEAPNQPGYLGITYRERQEDGSLAWSFQSLVSLLLVLLLFFGSGIVIVFCIWKVRAAMKRTDIQLASKTRHMQNQLFRALLVQTIIPTLTSYGPLGTVFIIPLTGLNMGGWGTIFMMSTAFFPLVDPFLVLFLVSGYRANLPSFLRKLVSSARPSVVTTTTGRITIRRMGEIQRLWLLPIITAVFCNVGIIVPYAIGAANGNIPAILPFISYPHGACQACAVCGLLRVPKTRHFVEKIVNHYIGFRFPHCSGTVCVAGNFSEMDALMVHNGAAAVTFLSVILYLCFTTGLSFLRPLLCSRAIAFTRVIFTILAIFFLVFHEITLQLHIFVPAGSNFSEASGGYKPEFFPTDSTFFVNHFISTLTDWLLAFTVFAYFGTFAEEFRKSSLAFPSIYFHAVEVQCNPLRVVDSPVPPPLGPSSTGANFVVAACAFLELERGIQLRNVPYLGAVAAAYWILQKSYQYLSKTMNQTEAEIRARFNRFFSNFSHIETLVLDGWFEAKTFDAVVRTLENRLEVIALTGSLKITQIMRLCRSNRVRSVLIYLIRIDSSTLDGFAEFVRALMSQEVILEIHERCHNESLYRPEIVHFFGENKKFWGKMRDDLTKDGVSLRMATVYNKRKILVKTYLRCEKMGPNHNLPLLTTKRRSTVMDAHTAPMSREEKTASMLPLEDAVGPNAPSEGTRRPDVIENHIPDIIGGRFTLAMKDVNLNNERRYNARMRRIKAQVRRVDPNYHPQVSDSYYFRLSVGKERHCNLYRVGLSDMCTVLAGPELNKKEGRVHLYQYWQPNYDSTRLELYYRLNSFTEQNAKRAMRLHAIWDLNAICMMMQNFEDLKLSKLLKTGKRRSHSISGILHPRAYQGALATEARRGILLLPFELIAAHEKIAAWREEKVGDIIQTLAEGPEKKGELTKQVADFVEANREWVSRAISCSIFGEQVQLPRHEYQLTNFLHKQQPLAFSLLPYWVGHGAHFVRCRKKNLKIQWTGRSPAVVDADGSTRPIKVRPSTLTSLPPPICNIVISSAKDDAELAIPQPNSKPGSLASGGPDTCTVSTATTTPMSFMHDWRYTSTHADYDHRLSSGPPKGCETAVNLEWRMRVNAEKQRRLRMLTSDGFVCHTTDVRYSSHGWGRAYREMQKRDNQFRRAQPFYQSRFLPSPDVYQEMKKEVEVRERVRELTGMTAEQQNEGTRSELKVLQHVLNQMALRRAIRTPDYRSTGKSLWASTGMFNPAIDVIQHSISYTDRPIEELIDRISINPALRVAAQSNLLSRRVVEMIATVIFTYPVTAISVLANIALIVIILTTHNQHVGAYRFLLLSFAVVDILISIVHFVLVPAIIMTEFGFIFYGFRFMADPTAIGVWMNLLFVALFYQTFVLLAFHYVYRYVLLCNPSWLRWIGRSNPWRNWIALAIVADALYIGGFMLAIKGGWIPNDKTRNAFEPMLKESYNIDLEAPNQPGYLGITYRERQEDGSLAWSFQSLVSLLLVLLLFFGSGIVIVFCIWKVRAAMKRTDIQLASKTRHMQNQLFRALLVQTIIPTLTSYGPLGTVFIIPLTGLNMGGWGTIFMMSTAFFPLVDPFLVLFLVSGYRANLPSFLRKLVSSARPSVVTTTTGRSETNKRTTNGERSGGHSGHNQKNGRDSTSMAASHYNCRILQYTQSVPRTATFRRFSLSSVTLTVLVKHVQFVDYYESRRPDILWRRLSITTLVFGFLTAAGLCVSRAILEMDALMVHNGAAAVTFLSVILYLCFTTGLSFLRPLLCSRAIAFTRVIFTILAIFFLVFHEITLQLHIFVPAGSNFSEASGGYKPEFFPTDSTFFVNHFISTLTDWLLAFTVFAYFGTFAEEFRKSSLAFPSIYFHVNESARPSAVEVQCNPLRVVDSPVPPPLGPSSTGANFVVAACAFLELERGIQLRNVPYLGAVAAAYWILQKSYQYLSKTMNQTEAEIRARFNRFFSNFSHIETLVLDGWFEAKTFDAVVRTLENRLEVIALTGSLKITQIMRLCRSNRVRSVLIYLIRIDSSTLDGFAEFVRALMSQEVILEIHERCHNESLYRPEIVHFFGENKKFWGKMRDDLTKDGVSLRMATVYNKRKILVKTYLRCEKMGPNHNLPLLTTKRRSTVMDAHTAPMSREEKTASMLPLEDAVGPNAPSEGTRRPDVIENHIPDIIGGRFTLAMKDVNLNNERRYNARMRRIKAQVRRVDPNYHPQVSDSYYFRLSVGKERHCNLYRVGLSDMCTVLAGPELNKKEGRVHLYQYWQPNYDSTRLELYYRLNSFTEQNAKRAMRLHAIWDLNAICMMMQNFEDLKLSKLLKTGKRRSHSISGILHPRAYQGALATEARRGILLLPFELIAAHEKIAAWREEKVGDIIQTLAEGPEKKGELTKQVADFVEANREWVSRAISCSIFGEQVQLPRHEYQLTNFLHKQQPLAFSLLPYWVGHGAHFVRCRKKNLKIQWTGRSPAVVDADGSTRPIKVRPSTLTSLPPPICNIVISSAKDDAELAIPQPNSKPGSLASGGPDTCTVSTATTTPMSFMHDWRYTSTHADYDHRLSSGPPKGCETAVNLEWRMRVNAEKQRRLRMLTSDGFVCHTTDVRYSSHGWGRAYREMQKRDNQFRRAQPFYQSRFLPSPDVYQEMKKEVEVRERVRELTGMTAEQQNEGTRSELKVLQHVLNQMALRRAIRTPDYRSTGKSLWASTGMFNPAIDVIQHSISYTDRPIEELIDRISINPALRVAAQSNLLSRRVVEMIATVIDVRRNLLVPLNIPYSSKIGVLRPTTRTDVLSNDSLLDRSPLFIVLLGALFLILNTVY
uniref:Serpentine receptor class r-10 n=1 Tax=Pristionchus pacificus TaxID=54126 RepID=A0A2A6BP64_PRIPA|eukprot:PDM67694.1 G protein-coupled receptor [Pristionchus pacificus]